MTRPVYLLRAMWAAFGVVAAILLLFGTGADVLIFLLAYGGRVGSYPGQLGDRHLAWRLLIWMAALWVFVLVTMIWPAIRWRRRGMYSPPDGS